jgi:hypothetical protein
LCLCMTPPESKKKPLMQENTVCFCFVWKRPWLLLLMNTLHWQGLTVLY